MGMSTGVTVPRRVIEGIMRYLEEEARELRERLRVLEAEIELLEKRYGISSELFVRMLRGKEKWNLPEDADLDIVEWEALLEQQRILRARLQRLEELWRNLIKQ